VALRVRQKDSVRHTSLTGHKPMRKVGGFTLHASGGESRGNDTDNASLEPCYILLSRTFLPRYGFSCEKALPCRTSSNV